MKLMALKKYLQSIKSASVLELSRHFGVAPVLVQDKLLRWVRKGRVRRSYKNTSLRQNMSSL